MEDLMVWGMPFQMQVHFKLHSEDQTSKWSNNKQNTCLRKRELKDKKNS